MAVLTVYGREDCHLCSEMIAALEPLQGRYGFTLEVVDVDRDQALEERYGALVPVLAAGNEEICHYFFDPDALQRHFALMAENPRIR